MTKEEFNEKVAIDQVARKARIEEHWNNLPTFVMANDVPALPGNIDKEEWKEFYVKKLIGADAIAKDKLVDGLWYYGEYRNSNFGKWDSNKQEFGLWRHKFGWMWDTCNHFEDDNGYSLFVPIRLATKEEINKQSEIENERNKTKNSGTKS